MWNSLGSDDPRHPVEGRKTQGAVGASVSHWKPGFQAQGRDYLLKVRDDLQFRTRD